MNLTAKTLAAAWRENLAGIRDRPHAPDWGGDEGAFNQLTITEPPPASPVEALEAILDGPPPAHLAAELASAQTGLTIAAARAAARGRHLAALAARTGTATLAQLIGRCTLAPDATARLLETLATDGHHLHPCARTRLGWAEADFARYDLETPEPIRIRLVADRAGLLARSGDDLRAHPMLAGIDSEHPVLPVHPWQLEHRIRPKYADLFASGRLEVLEATVPAWPTAAVRTLAGHRAPGSLKLALGIHITSTRRDISPYTAQLAPYLSERLASTGLPQGRHVAVPDTAGMWLPGARDLTAIGRSPLAEVTPAGAVCVPATALVAASPVTGDSLAAEYADWAGGAEGWIRDYAALVVPPILGKAAAGIGLEAHLQNSLVAFRGPDPVRVITRDLGGARIHLASVPFALTLPADSPVNAASRDQVRFKVAYTLFQNHLAAIVAVLVRDRGLDAAGFWADLADLVAGLELPSADRDAYLAERTATKALLTMRLRPGGEVETTVDNPMARRV